ncbi:MAG TPA: chemotaxis response regulator protein-glutamate methylesterase [Terracidiphilus sp.]|jgi:two-component system chemotaxis response regulator CheB|nr:chemotaxis response regulator protein-glutamate methylesterase [Terracidiphilus sp.]
MAIGRRTRILIVDDSAVMRSLLRSIIAADPQLEVAGTAVNGAAALQYVDTLSPDLMLLDVEMPVLDGLTTLKQLRKRGHRLPVIMCSALTQRGARVTIEALASGAADYVTKPAAQQSREAAVRALASELLPKIHALVRSGDPRSHTARPVMPVPPQAHSAMNAAPLVVAIGVSTGGPAALEQVLPALPSDFPLPVMVVQHMPELFTRLLAERLNTCCRLRVREAAEGDPLRPGTISMARGDWHLEALAPSCPNQPATLHLSRGPMENHCRPSVDVLFRSLAGIYGAGVLAVVLTGMGLDGLAGCRNLRSVGATVLAQDESSSAVWGMPGAVVNAGLAHRVVPLQDMAGEIMRIAGRKSNEAHELREAMV